jgi:hypothetical protein
MFPAEFQPHPARGSGHSDQLWKPADRVRVSTKRIQGEQFMRRYHQWLAALGLLAVTPGVTLAGPLNSNKKAPAQAATQAAASNPQVLADQVAAALAAARLDRAGNSVDVQVNGSVAILSGTVSSQKDLSTALNAASRVPGIRRVENRLQVPRTQPAQAAQAARPNGTAAATRSRTRRPASAVQQASFDDGAVATAAGYEDDPMVEYPNAGPGAYRQMSGAPMGPTPSYGMSGIAPGATVYNSPNFPNYAWPSYAAYPNYAAVSYPNQYSASAWPYIGPFYPYPQVPLGWRKAQLEWDDGYWRLNFRPRTDRWWWFLDFRNW